MPKKVVISQSMYFPWVGLLEQIRLADIFIHYDDVQYARGFFSRVQVKTNKGPKWLSIPLRNHHRGQLISEVQIDESKDWRSQHRDILRQAYLKAPYRDEMLALVDDVYSKKLITLSDVSRESIIVLSRYFSLNEGTEFIRSEELSILGASSQRLCDICVSVGADVYITGHGARNYIDHDLFERSGIKVEYMKYNMIRYSQLHSDFTPFVSALDLVANCGQGGASVITSNSVYWKDFLKESN